MRISCFLFCCSIGLSAACNRNTPDRQSLATPQSANNAPLADATHKPHAGTSPDPIPQPQLSTEEIQAGWIQLFDGTSLFGWKPNNDVNWSVSAGVIQADTGSPGLLLTTVSFADFELRCDFRLQAGGNSGIFLRSSFAAQDPTQDCYELNICDSHPAFPTGSIVGRKKVEESLLGEASWRTFSVRAQGATITAALDGTRVMEFTDDESHSPHLKSGFVGLQKNEGQVAFRNIWLRPLGMQPLFNGQDLSGWHEVPGSKSRFTVENAAIHVSNGPGFLETNKVWDDFILQFDGKTNGALLNSGVFFRAQPGSKQAPSNGYEFQIHNGFENGDRSQPSDAGTGAIFRRTQARWIASDDESWFTATLIADGPHFATWVNGLQVSDWTDEREPDDNPRRGNRLEAGHISLQGHDPTTNLNFRKIRLAPLSH